MALPRKWLIFNPQAIASKRLDINHILCSNLVHFAFLVEVLQKTPNVQSVDTPMKAPNTNNSLRIDVIADNGSQWIKVIARNPKALKDIALGCSNYGAKSIIDQAIDFVQCAEMNQCLFRTPQVRTIFFDDFWVSSLAPGGAGRYRLIWC